MQRLFVYYRPNIVHMLVCAIKSNLISNLLIIVKMISTMIVPLMKSYLLPKNPAQLQVTILGMEKRRLSKTAQIYTMCKYYRPKNSYNGNLPIVIVGDWNKYDTDSFECDVKSRKQIYLP